MTEREALTDLLRSNEMRPSCQAGMVTRCLCQGCATSRARAVLAQPVAAEGWVSVDERLPEEPGEYITYSPRSVYQVNADDWLADEGAWLREWVRKKRTEAKPKSRVTHWRPLPPPPTSPTGE